ncbi:MAG: DUF1697 domain-containing protein [Minisyncoccia bacterium]
MRYAAFLRGINVGGRLIVKMADLTVMLEKAGFTEVQTILTSGNVIFDSETTNSEALEKKIETLLQKKYKRDIAVMVRNISEIKKMDAFQPFSGVKTTPNTRLYVVFLSEHSKGVKIPDENVNFRIVRILNGDAFVALELSDEYGTTDWMKTLEKVFGKRFTTRNWNTIQKVLKSAA